MKDPMNPNSWWDSAQRQGDWSNPLKTPDKSECKATRDALKERETWKQSSKLCYENCNSARFGSANRATLPRVGCWRRRVGWAVAGRGNLQCATTVTTLGGGPQLLQSPATMALKQRLWHSLFAVSHAVRPRRLTAPRIFFMWRTGTTMPSVILTSPSVDTYTFAPYPPYIPTNLISQPVGVAVDALGDVFVLNRGNGKNGTVLEFD